MKLKSDHQGIQYRVSTKRNTSSWQRRARTVEHGTVLEQREVHGVVHMVRVWNDVVLVRDFGQTLRSGWMSDAARADPPKERAHLDGCNPISSSLVRERSPLPADLGFHAFALDRARRA